MAKYRGSPLGIKLIITLYNQFGYAGIKWLVWIVALFYAIISRAKRSELDSYYKAVGLESAFSTYFRHIHAFSLNIFDRFVANESTQEKLTIERVNVEAFQALHKSGGILTLSHHGNWAQSFKIFQTYDVKLNIIGDEAIDEGIQKLETQGDANRRINIISMKEGMQAMLDIARAINNQEIIIIMVDRITQENKTVNVDFLGKKTCLNSGAFEIARMRNTPMLGCDIVRDGDEKLKVQFSDIIISQQTDKEKIIPDLAQQYANFLEKVVREYPLQWFNFYEFWEEKEIPLTA
ncbi:MAG: hypothetical protein DRG24_07365 [Epsilonproteobacteria bacterium]|nr:MAG: hypothetical protein DRG24_07365 [Campylobacterota bacterium]